MKTWVKQLADALPQAIDGFIDDIVHEYCPYELFRDAPHYTNYNDNPTACERCWSSCSSKCLIDKEGGQDVSVN